MDVFNNCYLYPQICGLNYNLTNIDCAKAGLWNVLKIRIQPGQEVDSRFIGSCIENGNLSFIEWLTEKNISGFTSDAMNFAAQCGQFEIVKWLSENGKGKTAKAMQWAAEWGHLKVVKWLSENSPGYTTLTFDLAAHGGHLDIVKWLDR